MPHERRDARGYDGLLDPQELREYADQLNEARHIASLPRGFRLAPRTRRILVQSDPTTPSGLTFIPDDEDDYPEPPPPTSW